MSNLGLFLRENLPFDFDLLPQDSYLVGGAVRDALLQRSREYLDLDFVLATGAASTAREIARTYHAGFVVLDEEREIARVVFDGATVDFARREGESLGEDLRRRDFTINAIAYNPHTDCIADPLGGQRDLEARILRMVSATNLKDDPLRLLRAYRQASQLNFTIEARTRSTIKTLVPLIGTVAAERVRAELGYLLGAADGSKWLKEACDDGLLSVWLENISAEGLKLADRVGEAMASVAHNFPQLEGASRRWLYLARLVCLLAQNPEIAELELVKLKYSRQEIRRVMVALKNLPQLLRADSSMGLAEQYFFFLEVRDVFPLVAVLAIAANADRTLMAILIGRYLDMSDPVAHPQPLVTGNDLMDRLKLKPSPKIGQLLTAIQLAYIEGKISNAREALNLSSSFLERGVADCEAE